MLYSGWSAFPVYSAFGGVYTDIAVELRVWPLQSF